MLERTNNSRLIIKKLIVLTVGFWLRKAMMNYVPC